MTTTTIILAAGTTELESADVVLDDGKFATLTVTGQTAEYGRAFIYLRKKTSAGYTPKGPPSESLNNFSLPVGQLRGPLSFKLFRPAGSASIGAEIERA